MTTQYKKIDFNKLGYRGVDLTKVSVKDDYDYTCNVVIFQGMVCIDCELMQMLNGHTEVRKGVRLGRKRFMDIAGVLDNMLDRAMYADRNENEKMVTTRNLKIVEILMQLQENL